MNANIDNQSKSLSDAGFGWGDPHIFKFDNSKI
jgi:hypothetical protein